MSTAARPRLILRADGNPRIGLGHVMRLLALGEILSEQFTCVFAIQEPADAVLEQLRMVCEEVVEVPPMPYDGEPAWLTQNLLQPTDVLVLDGYGFGHSFQQAVRPAVARLVYVDDLLAFPQLADLVLNPAGGVSPTSYELENPHTRLLLGPHYAPLRQAFREVTLPERTADSDTVLVCLGGADPTHQTQRVADELLALSSVQRVHVVVGSAFAGWEVLTHWAQTHPRITLHRNLPAAELCLLMQQCGAAVCSPSTVSYEYCAAGGGLLFLLPVADNQQNIDRFLRGEGMALPYPSITNVLTSPEADRIADRLRQQQGHWFDGQISHRLQQEFTALLLPQSAFQLRPVVAADSAQLLAWTNDPTVRQFSFNSNPVSPSEHEQWLTARLGYPQHLLLIAEDKDSKQPIGLIRFSLEGEDATLSYLLDAAYRGQGLAPQLLVEGTRRVLQERPALRRVLGHVQQRNEASIRAFRRAGFQLLSEANSSQPDSVTFVWVN
ncbi:UDP-2,4-diacetamido-2,4,6-trideoxy-beta-L-altropyranose hydrolase [Hymenobacter sp. DG25A]|uniref:UDP-2,4-diacetamido-2,4, 6-trideoxy-beta-L-altropyranose hydrolase n=1 Tax=Hymenobacter sp. DG25A TaxID=1385663 RepID=UPI0006BE1663|nr:UDP-2,4-diacetamido-2,4,6-trideoxy-beta-L-altropyranose hydrolase [Hymenobacter sp. DG25A]ALD21135.1 hypothetical protein AM218_07805 [Hymenobacter sp. DG25A]